MIYNLRYSFVREVSVNDGAELDLDYQLTFARSQLNKVFGAGKVSEVEITEVMDEDGNPVNGE